MSTESRITANIRIDDLTPSAELTRQTDRSKWESTGTNPHFIAEKPFSPGWIRLRLKLHSSIQSQPELFLDTGNGFVASECIRLGEITHNSLEVDLYLNPDKHVRAVRFDPLDRPGVFRLESFSLKTAGPTQLFMRSLGTKFNEIRNKRNPSATIKYGLGLLARGDFSTLKHKLMQSLGGAAKPGNRVYEHWRNLHKLTDAVRDQMQSEVIAWKNPPLISLLLPVHSASETNLRAAIESILRQNYPGWELCVVDDPSSSPHVAEILNEYTQRDKRIRVVRQAEHAEGSATLNEALAMATGQYFTVIEENDELAPHALFKIAQSIMSHLDVDFIYSDEDQLDPQGRHINPFFKPDWSPEYMLAYMYTGRLSVFSSTLARQLDGYRIAVSGAHEYDLALRMSARARKIVHISDVLYHHRITQTRSTSDSAQASTASIQALKDWLVFTGQEGTVIPGLVPGTQRVRFAIKQNPTVSIIIPSTCKPAFINGKSTAYVRECIRSILKNSTYKNFEIIVLDRNQMSPTMHSEFEKAGIRRITYTDTFNWSRVNNLGAANASGQHLLFLNDDIEIITPDWLESLIEFSQLSAVGAVGAKLLFPNRRLQHTGVFLLGGIPGHQYYDCPGSEKGYFNCNVVHRDYSAVTGACLMTRADVFRSLGGFSEDLWLNYNDVDYCLKAVTAGLRVVYTPYAQCFHYESVSKPGTYAEELAAFRKKWQTWQERDPYFSEHSLELSKG